MEFNASRTRTAMITAAVGCALLLVSAPAASARTLSTATNSGGSGATVRPQLAAIDECLEGLLLPTDVIEGWGRGDHTYQLRCGDPTKGLFHIERDHGPLDGATGDIFSECLGKIIQLGDDKGAGRPANSRLFQLNYSSGNGGKAVALVDDETGDVLTAYTSGTSKEWRNCVQG